MAGDRVRTVIVRVFEPAEGSAEVELHGVVEDVRTGQRFRFRGGEQLLRAISRARSSAADPVGKVVDRNPLAPPSGPAPTGTGQRQGPDLPERDEGERR